MWFLVQVVKGSKYFEAESRVGNQVLISDSTDMVIAARGAGMDDYRFEARKGNETFVLQEFRGKQSAGAVALAFSELARQVGALVPPAGAQLLATAA